MTSLDRRYPPTPTVKRPVPPDYPEPGPRGYMRERAIGRQNFLAGRQRPRPPKPTRTNCSHSTHTAPAAQAVNALHRAWRRRSA